MYSGQHKSSPRFANPFQCRCFFYEDAFGLCCGCVSGVFRGVVWVESTDCACYVACGDSGKAWREVRSGVGWQDCARLRPADCAGCQHRRDENRNAGRGPRCHRDAAAGKSRKRKIRRTPDQETSAGTARGAAPQACGAGAPRRGATAPAVRPAGSGAHDRPPSLSSRLIKPI